MGYTLTIGEAKPCPPDPSDEPGGSFTWDVDEMSHDDAPRAPNDANPGANFRWPSYGVWADFARDVGLYDMLIDRDGEGTLMPRHPGIAPLYPWHRDRVSAALADFRAKHPAAVARFSDNPMGGDADPMAGANASLARLEWLDWWIRWAIDNCKHPAMSNS